MQHWITHRTWIPSTLLLHSLIFAVQQCLPGISRISRFAVDLYSSLGMPVALGCAHAKIVLEILFAGSGMSAAVRDS
jgi:hypothetical protein